MKKNFLKIFAILVLVILQLAFFSKISFFVFVPNVIFLVSLILLFRGFFADSLLVATIGGLFLDLASPFRFGLYTLFLVAILLFCHFFVLKNMPTLNPLLIFVFSMAIFIFFDLLISLIIDTLPTWQILINGLFNGLAGLAFYFVLEKLTKKEEVINVNL